MKETGLTGKRRSTTIAATPDDGNSQRKRRRRHRGIHKLCYRLPGILEMITKMVQIRVTQFSKKQRKRNAYVRT